jgi:hypothetical protein
MARMRFLPFLAALSCGSLAMGIAFGFVGKAYLDNPVIGLIVSALIPIVVWPLIYTMLRRPKELPEPCVSAERRP